MSILMLKKGDATDHNHENNIIANENDNENQNVNKVDPPENKRACLEAELSNGIKMIISPKFYGTTLGDGANNWLSEMEKYFVVRNFLEESQ
ncbi:hypothetical protein KI387_023750, partial [Taxus chinensis]